MVATSAAPLSSSRSTIAIASADPSAGSVPAPSSSSSTSDRGPARSSTSMMAVMWPEKVESDCSIDCSSPMSAKIAS